MDTLEKAKLNFLKNEKNLSPYACKSEDAIYDCAKQGNGYARITRLN